MSQKKENVYGNNLVPYQQLMRSHIKDLYATFVNGCGPREFVLARKAAEMTEESFGIKSDNFGNP